MKVREAILWIVVIVFAILLAGKHYGIWDKRNVPVPVPVPAVIQLDKTEYQIYKFAIDNVAGDDLQEQKQSLNRLLGTLSQKQAIIDAYPDERVEVLP